MNIVSTAAQASALSSGNVFVRSAAVFVMSMLPFIENKGAIILAAARTFLRASAPIFPCRFCCG